MPFNLIKKTKTKQKQEKNPKKTFFSEYPLFE
jgi:hypothetical protein